MTKKLIHAITVTQTTAKIFRFHITFSPLERLAAAAKEKETDDWQGGQQHKPQRTASAVINHRNVRAGLEATFVRTSHILQNFPVFLVAIFIAARDRRIVV
jgi:hypothetical protein